MELEGTALDDSGRFEEEASFDELAGTEEEAVAEELGGAVEDDAGGGDIVSRLIPQNPAHPAWMC